MKASWDNKLVESGMNCGDVWIFRIYIFELPTFAMLWEWESYVWLPASLLGGSLSLTRWAGVCTCREQKRHWHLAEESFMQGGWRKAIPNLQMLFYIFNLNGIELSGVGDWKNTAPNDTSDRQMNTIHTFRFITYLSKYFDYLAL